MRRIVIKRTNNQMWPPNRYGIILKYLRLSDRKFLIYNRHIKSRSHSDQFVACVLRMSRNIKKVETRKLYYDWENNSIMNIDKLIKNYNTIDWTCAISLKPIKAEFMNFDLDNFVHPEYKDVLDAPMVDSRILKSSIEFRKACEKILIEQRDKFLKLAKKGSKNTDNLDELKED